MGSHSFWPVAPADLSPALFDSARWPRKPYCSDDKTARYIRPFLSALKRSYIQANPPHLRVWSIYDIDRPGAAIAWEDAMLPPPSWAVSDVKTLKGHLVYGLSAPVLVDSPDMRQAPLRYLCAIEAAFRAKLGADQSYSGLMTKNPLHGDWLVFPGPPGFYELGDLAGWVDLPKFLPKRGKNPEQIGLGRNVTLFDDLRKWAYRNIRRYKGEVRNFVYWRAECYSRSLDMNNFSPPLDGRECYHIAKSVSRWVWVKFDIAASDARFSKLQAYRGRQGGIAKGVANEENRVSARLMHAQGINKSEISRRLNVPRPTVIHWLRELS